MFIALILALIGPVTSTVASTHSATTEAGLTYSVDGGRRTAVRDSQGNRREYRPDGSIVVTDADGRVWTL